jgi:GT2 family glycosyltransferase
MTFWSLYFLVLRWRPVKALHVLYWRVVGKKLRAANLLRRAAASIPAVYSKWIDGIEQVEKLRESADEQVRHWHYKPSFSVMVYAPDGTSELLRRTIGSIERQIYPFGEIILVHSGGDSSPPNIAEGSRLRVVAGSCADLGDALSAAAAQAKMDYILPLNEGDELSPAALFWAAEALQDNRSAAVLYGDHDELDSRDERKRPWFKPAWNSEMFFALDYISPAALIQSALLRRIAQRPDKDLHSLLLEATACGPVIHIPHILCHVREGRPDDPRRIEAVSRNLEDSGAKAVAGPLGTVKVEWPLPQPAPAVTIIVPTRDKLMLLQPCVESVLNRTDYGAFELVIVDNGSDESETLDYLERVQKDPRVTVLRYDRPYNYAAINNFAARKATGHYLCLLNNDTQVLNDSWLTELMRYAVRPDVGAVGAKLLYPDGAIQHAGVVIGMGGAAGHPHRFTDSSGPGYFRQTHAAQFVSAVTAACLAVEKRKFFAVGGFDQVNFAVAYNDVDLCLKLQRHGWSNVYTPHAVLIHHESKSRGADTSELNMPRYTRELNALRERWGTETYADPQHNPNLDRNSETFVVRL